MLQIWKSRRLIGKLEKGKTKFRVKNDSKFLILGTKSSFLVQDNSGGRDSGESYISARRTTSFFPYYTRNFENSQGVENQQVQTATSQLEHRIK